ncbi:Ig-like domain-containing protein [Candidatus Nitrospira neomarina]|uniref:Ig-like domain-containing protein n=1 Tax=Candidatus Nitrospira neomarina TaxID=3020899 RepID=A0AA96JVB3_9BACT|nr:Ig-like domain-containing protein [Candidatus Nitrospira neomarina]WNM61273.1 Ig-like domain-containing protein [Candidatus Nitrospira neomarina]
MSDVRAGSRLKRCLAWCLLGSCLLFLPPGAQAATSNSATLQWTANQEANLAGYRIYRGTNPGVYGVPTTVGKITTYQYTQLLTDKTHYFTVTAFDASGNESLPSPEVKKYIAPSSPSSGTSSPPPSSSLSISNLTVASGATYMVSAAGLQAGGRVYRDRAYTFTTVPTSVQGAAYIQTANNDKAATTTAFLRFTVNQPVSVTVAYDVRLTPKPSWLSSFTDTGKNLVTSDTTLRLYARAFPAGTITLGGNASGGDGSMYSVIVQPAEGPIPDITPPTVALVGIQNGKSLSGTVTVSAIATDNIGVVGVQFRLNGKNLGVEDTTLPFSQIWNTTGVAPGQYTLTAIARDAAGNTTSSAPVTGTVANPITPPTPISTNNPTTSPLAITNLTVASGAAYGVSASGLRAGGTVYRDRAYTFTTVPTSVQGAAYIQTANNDKAATTAAFLRFTVNQPVSVTVAYDVRLTPKPSWLSSFTDTGKNLVTSDTTLHLHARAFPAGTITLGGNAGGGSGSMYSVIVQPSAPGTTTVANPTTSSLTISNLTVASGAAYGVSAAGLRAGGTVYRDRAYTFTTVPTSVQGAAYIQTANNDKAATTAAFLRFTVNQPVSVTVAYDVRLTPKPSWLSSFTDTGKNLVTSDTTLHLFARPFPAGTITLGGNASGKGGSMYSVIVQPSFPLTISNLIVANGAAYGVSAAGLRAGGTVYRDRAYTFTTVPTSVQGAAYIQTANNDKAATTAAFLRFTVNQPVSVTVAYDVRLTPKPSWLSAFTDTGKNLVTSDTTLRLYARAFPAGTITLGGNAGVGSGSMYSVIVQPLVQ